PNFPVALSATESHADIHSGTNVPCTLDNLSNDPYKRNFCVDNALFASAIADSLLFEPFLPGPDLNATQIKTSVPLVILNCKDIDLCERSRGISHKIFTHLGYTFDGENIKPFIGIGAFGEFGKTKHNSSSSCNPCP